MPHIEQICNRATINPAIADDAWNSFTHYAQGTFGLLITDYYGDEPKFTSPVRTGGRDMIFVVTLDAQPERVSGTIPDSNAQQLAKKVQADMVAACHGPLNICVLLAHAACGWGEAKNR